MRSALLDASPKWRRWAGMYGDDTYDTASTSVMVDHSRYPPGVVDLELLLPLGLQTEGSAGA